MEEDGGRERGRAMTVSGVGRASADSLLSSFLLRKRPLDEWWCGGFKGVFTGAHRTVLWLLDGHRLIEERPKKCLVPFLDGPPFSSVQDLLETDSPRGKVL